MQQVCQAHGCLVGMGEGLGALDDGRLCGRGRRWSFSVDLRIHRVKHEVRKRYSRRTKARDGITPPMSGRGTNRGTRSSRVKVCSIYTRHKAKRHKGQAGAEKNYTYTVSVHATDDEKCLWNVGREGSKLLPTIIR